ncbi:vWA domain-containing protein [Citrobacter amalonaticus]|uniref:vWA domain-containing protein n=1 Tax=Citrobacter amalonaticus TaxID=35703 RepID=UPI00076B823C|nr:VWA domain-containing protein [Citrobacter amalonaticus]AMG92365.1 VWA domain-containing protein [Citrobacter amalonaticus]MBJ9259877.1 VWA domain-containing protein [Citrobacter amalonaticus]MCO4161026.1 VWA domain-containing protein [Citrobacter amalonaticus]MDT7077489.1 VWA domain-containing protein [Citrobacter amalonaticus]HAU5066299.1 VWA domain-containing protein [Citrobacter amalonaticus]
MNLKHLFAALALGLLATTTAAQPPAPKVTIKSELASPLVLENSQDKNYLKVSLTGFPLHATKRSPINLALVIDRSGSMRGDRIEQATEAAVMAVNTLSAQDTLSVVIYDDVVDVIVPAAKIGNKATLISQIRERLTARGGTALFAGVSRGIKETGKFLDKAHVNRIILLSDGQANVGPSSTSELAELGKIAARKGIAITTMGIGEGYNEDLMAAIAQYSDGNHVFVQNTDALEKAFAHEFGDVMSVVAQDVVVQINVADNVKPLRLLGREGEIRDNRVTVKLNQLYANQEKYVMLEVLPAKGQAAQSKPLAEVNVSYNNLATGQKERWDDKMAVSYTASASDVQKAQVEDVVVDSAIQKSAIQNEQALQLIDEGKMDEAKAILRENSSTLSALPLSAPAARMKAQESAEENLKLLDRMESESKEASRKSLKEQSYKTKNQSSKSN